MKVILLIAAIVLLAGCESDNSSTTGPDGTLPGDIVGVVALVDTAGAWLSNHSGAMVSIEGSSYSTISDSAGVFRLKDVPPGTYTLRFEKANFTSKKIFSIQHAGNGTLYLPGYQSSSSTSDTWLAQIPTISFDLALGPFNITHDSVFMALFRTTLSSGLNQYHNKVTLLFSKDSIIVPSDERTFAYPRDGGYKDSTGISSSVFRETLMKYGFSSGSKVFVTATLRIDSYFDVQQRKIIYFYAKNSSEVKSFVLP